MQNRPRAPIVAKRPSPLPYIPKHEIPAPAPVSRPAPARPTLKALDFAEALNVMSEAKVATEAPSAPSEPIKRQGAPAVPPAATEPVIASKTGESLLEMARRLKETRKSINTD